MVGERTAEEVKIAIGTALPLERELHMEVRGRDLIAGLPRTIPLTSSEVMEALEQPLQQIVAARPRRARGDAARSCRATSSTRAWSCPAAGRCCATSTSC